MDTTQQNRRNKFLYTLWENHKDEYSIKDIVKILAEFNLSLPQAYKVLRDIEKRNSKPKL